MASIAERLRAQAEARLDKVPLSRQHLALIEVDAADLRELVLATPAGLEGQAGLARDSWMVSSLASAGRVVSVRADHVVSLASHAGTTSAAAVPALVAPDAGALDD